MALSSLTTLAQLMALSPADAIALPTVMDVASGRVGMTPNQLREEALVNEPLREYLAELCRNAIAEIS